MAKSLKDILAELTDEEPEGLIGELVERSKTHLPVIILLDTSYSMSIDHQGETNISRVDRALRDFVANVANGTNEAYQRIREHGDFCIITYGNGRVDVVVPWSHGSQLDSARLPKLAADGDTPMYQAIITAGDMMLEILRTYRRDELDAFRGAVFNLTDGQPTDGPNRQKAIQVVQLFETAGTTSKALAEFHHVGVPGFDQAALSEISIDPSRVIALGSADIAAFFHFLQITFSGIAGDATSAVEQANMRQRRGD